MDGAETEQGSWQRALAGDGESFGRLFELHRRRVFRHAHRLLQDADDAEDAVAIAFLEMWRCRDRVRLVEGSTLPWLLVTAGNAARNLSRSRVRYRALLASLPHGDHHASAEDEFSADEVSDQQLADALRGLPTRDMHLVDLVMLEGYTPSEAALVLGITAGAARTRLHRVRASLQSQLRPPAARTPSEGGRS